MIVLCAVVIVRVCVSLYTDCCWNKFWMFVLFLVHTVDTHLLRLRVSVFVVLLRHTLQLLFVLFAPRLHVQSC